MRFYFLSSFDEYSEYESRLVVTGPSYSDGTCYDVAGLDLKILVDGFFKSSKAYKTKWLSVLVVKI